MYRTMLSKNQKVLFFFKVQIYSERLNSRLDETPAQLLQIFLSSRDICFDFSQSEKEIISKKLFHVSPMTLYFLWL